MESAEKRTHRGGLVPYIGGKRNLARRLVARIEAIPHLCYAEPFVGAGGIFFRRTRPAKVEAINDYNREVYTLFRVLQVHYAYFINEMRFVLGSRAEFERLVRTDPATLTDIHRAARFYYLQQLSFAGLGKTFGISPVARARLNIARLESVLDDAHSRLAGVTIECLPYADFIRRWDRPTTLFYLDPPYWGTEDVYGKGLFGKEDFERLAEVLAGLEGRFILSLNDVPEVRRTFAGFALEEVETTYSAGGGGKQKRVRELIIGPPLKRRKSAG